MFYFILLLSNFFISFKCNDDFFVAKKYGDPNYYCVTNSSYALNWISNSTDVSNDATAQVSTFIPKREQPDFFDMDINENEDKTKLLLKKNKNWSLIKSLDSSEFNDVILDRRWEDMTLYKTTPDTQPLVIVHNLKNDFHIPISIRTEGDAQIFLCHGQSTSECYEFRVQNLDKRQRSIIVERNKIKPRNRLVDLRFESIKYLSNSTWTHFMLIKSNNFLSLKLSKYNWNKPFLEASEDKSKLINVTHMIIHSRRQAFWKIHELEFIYTQKSNEVLKLDSIINVTDNSVCISMFIWMCEFCELNLKLHIPKNPFYVIDGKQYKQEENGWKEIKFIVENVEVEQVVLTITTSGSYGSIFWAIDKIRLCQNEEYRMIQTTVQSDCNLLSKRKNYIISYKNQSYNENKESLLSLVENKCSEKTFSGLCVPCTWFPFQNCLQIKVCEKGKSDKVKCFCSAGYNGDECIKECDRGTFGHGCKQKCEKCLEGVCNNDDGKCSKCVENYTGAKCEIPPEPVFAEAPKIKHISYTKVTIEMKNFSIINEDLNDRSGGYVIQHKKNTSDEWLDFDFKLYKNYTVITIYNLEVDTQYNIRAIVVSTKGHKYTKGLIKTINFTTKCDDFTDESFHVIPSNTSVEVLLNISNQTCKIIKGRINLLDIEKQQLSMSTKIGNNTSIFFEHLTPYTKYEIDVVINSRNYKKSFETTYGVPGQIRNLKITKLSAKSVTLKWESPLAMNGKFKLYRFEYEHLSYKSCGLNSTFKSNKISKITKSSFLTVNNLIPYSDYSFSVYASNDKFENLPYTLNHSTASQELIQNEEMPQLISSWIGVRNISLKFSEINCTKIKGILLLKITAECCEEWCKNAATVKSFNYNPTTTQLTLSNLYPFSKYNLTVEFCRNETFCSEYVIKKLLQTEYTVPMEVRDLLVYSKNESSVSVRWKSPHPPTGELAEYLIKYHSFNSTQKEIFLKSFTFPCKLWPDFYCYKILNLTQNRKYKLVIQARNQNPPEYGQSRELYFETKKEKSDAPYDLNIEWALNNDLNIQWKHPNVTNGNIQRFDIIIFELNTEKIRRQLKVNEENYTLEYNFVVEAILFQPSTLYTIEISAYNGYFGNSIKKTDTSPPAIPSLLYNNPKFSLTNNNMHFEFSLDKTKVLQNNNYTLFLLISGENINLQPLQPRLKKLAKISNLTNCFLLYESSLLNLNSSYSFTIGDGVEVKNCNNFIKNVKLDPSTFYNITILFANHFGNKTSYKIYSFNVQTEKCQKQTNLSLLALLSLLLISTGIVIYVKHNSVKKILCTDENLENQHEELPLTDCPENLIDTQNQNSEINTYSEEHEYQYSRTHSVSTRPQINNDESNPESRSTNIKTQNKTKRTKINKELAKHKLEKYEYPRTESKVADSQDKLESFSKLVPIAEFKEYIEKCIKTGELKQQYDMVLNNPIEPKYQTIKEKQYFGYIDVNINGEEIPKAYIASEIPKPEEIADFWKMIWDDHVEHIIMLDAWEKEIDINYYWPENKQNIECHDIQIQHFFTKILEHYELRMFILNYGEEIRKVDQLLLRKYNDRSFPSYSEHFLPFFQKILRWPLIPNSPILIHCSDGIEGTGFVILCDMCLRISKKKNEVDVFKNLQKLCDYNNKMINYDYYKLVHLVILEYYFDFVSIEDLTILYENV